MSTWALLAPGPSASADLAGRLRGMRLGAVNNACQLAPWAEFIAAADRGWWLKHTEYLRLPGRKFCTISHPETEWMKVPGIAGVNSGVFAMEVAKHLGATRILLFGFDMHGTHFFGSYVNGLRNTKPERRLVFLEQYAQWATANPAIEVLNCTSGSALKCFPMASPDEVLPEPATTCAA